MIFKREPAVILGLVSALIAVAIGFGLDITSEQVGLIMAAVSAVIGVITRSQVSPTALMSPEMKRRITER